MLLSMRYQHLRLLALPAIALVATAFVAFVRAQPATETITVQVNRPGAAVSPTLFGLFFEDINFAADGGLYPELVKNRSFEFTEPLAGWNRPMTAEGQLIAMAEDGLFFRQVAKVNAKTRVPIVAIVLQGVAAIAIALSGTYGQILGYVVSVDFIFFGLTGAALFIFRKRDGGKSTGFNTPLHPITTGFFVVACAITVMATVWNDWRNSLIGYAILAAGVPACLYWQRKNRSAPA